MKIAFDIRRLHDHGIGTYIRNLVLHLASLARKTSVVLVARPGHPEELEPLPPNFGFLMEPTAGSSLWDNLVLPRLLDRRRVDLLHTPHYHSPRFLRCRSVITVHDCVHVLFPRAAGSKAEFRRAWLRTRRSVRRCSRIIAVSEATRRDLTRLFNVPGEKITVIHNAIDERLTAPSGEEEKKRILERYQVDAPFLLYTGNVRPHKNLARAIEAFAVLKSELREDPEWRDLKLLIIGDELSRYQLLRRTAVRGGLQHEVRFLGFVPYETLRVFYRTAQIFVFPSLYEGFGLPPLEAMANGTPVLTSNVSSLPEVLGDAALLVNPENVFDISKGLRQLLFDSSLRRDLREKGFRQVKKYSWKKSTEMAWKTYEQVLGRPLES